MLQVLKYCRNANDFWPPRSSDHKMAPKWTANDPRQQTIPTVDGKMIPRGKSECLQIIVSSLLSTKIINWTDFALQINAKYKIEGTEKIHVKLLQLMRQKINAIIFFLSLRAGGIFQILQNDWFRERAVFLRSCPLTRVESLWKLHSQVYLLLVNEQKPWFVKLFF